MKHTRKWLTLLLALLVGCGAMGAGAEEGFLTVDQGWKYTGYTPGGVTFAIPLDFESYDTSLFDRMAGILILGGNADFTLQLRQFSPDTMTYAEFAARIQAEPTARWGTRMDGGSEILWYRNTAATANSELFGIALTGLDGMLYKISIFTGDGEDYSPDARVWALAETIAQTVRHQDFAEWSITDEAAAD